jgi:hypothetical protein
MRIRSTVACCTAGVAALLATAATAAHTPLNACRLVTKAEANLVIGHPVIFHQGESVQGCAWGVGAKVMVTIDVYNDDQVTSSFNSFPNVQRRLHGTSIGGLGSPAFYFTHTADGETSRGVWVHHHGWVLQVGSSGQPGLVLSYTQLRAIARYALMHF